MSAAATSLSASFQVEVSQVRPTVVHKHLAVEAVIQRACLDQSERHGARRRAAGNQRDASLPACDPYLLCDDQQLGESRLADLNELGLEARAQLVVRRLAAGLGAPPR